MTPDYAIIMTFLQTGIRLSELTALQLEDVDFEKRLITVRQGKGHKDRHEGGERVTVLDVGRHHPQTERAPPTSTISTRLRPLTFLFASYPLGPRCGPVLTLKVSMIAAVGRRLRTAATRRQATKTARARSSTARHRQRVNRLHTLWCGGRPEPTGSRRRRGPGATLKAVPRNERKGLISPSLALRYGTRS